MTDADRDVRGASAARRKDSYTGKPLSELIASVVALMRSYGFARLHLDVTDECISYELTRLEAAGAANVSLSDKGSAT